MGLEGRLCVLAVRWNGFVKHAAATVVQPVGANFLVAVVQKFHAGVHIALHGSQVAFITARTGCAALLLPFVVVTFVAVFAMVAVLIHLIGTFSAALLVLINFLVDLLKRISCIGNVGK